DVARIVKEFIDLDPSVDYFKMNGVNERLEDAMREEIRSRNIVSVQLDKTIHLAASLIELAFKDCSLEEKTNIALYTCFILYIDDVSTKNMTPFVEFQQRFFRHEQQLDQVLDAFADVLRRMYEQYPALFGNLFLSATFEFITTTCAEPGIEALPVLRGAKRFPTFLRDRTGLGVPYAFMVYLNSRSTDFVTCFQALPDMSFWFAAINDLLSFYKEELAGETVNYVYNRAKVENSDPLHVLLTIRDELLEASDNVTRALSGPAPVALKAWKDFEAGVM
ncbi:hypothetical protein H0H87_009323, partial [Tephrocybe sp. NHM501043]